MADSRSSRRLKGFGSSGCLLLSLTLAGVAVDLPAAFKSSFDLVNSNEWGGSAYNDPEFWLAQIRASPPASLAICLAALSFLWFVQRKKPLWTTVTVKRVAERWVRARWLHIDQISAFEEAPHYTSVMERQTRLLGLDTRLLAQTAGIPFLVARFLLENPTAIPRPDIWAGLERALLLPRGYFRRGGSYGVEYTKIRLLWYHSRGIARAYSIGKIEKASQRSCSAMLARIEQTLDEEAANVEDDCRPQHG